MLLHQGPGAGKDTDDLLFGQAALASLFELNALFLNTLTRIAGEPDHKGADDPIDKLAQSLSRQTVTARDTLAQCPIALVDMGFRDNERWARVLAKPEGHYASPGGIFPYLDSIRLAQQTLTLAWSTARAASQGARIVFGMTRACANTLAQASLPTIQRVAERHPHWVRPIWEHQPDMWDYLITMSASPPKQLPSVGLRALQRRLAELEPATLEDSETRSDRDLE